MNRYLLIGNPNVGKTTFFNQITDSNNKISNYSGTTVDIHRGILVGTDDEIIDIPGIRSLIAYGEDEVVAVQSFLQEKNGVILNILDSNNLKRNLQLSIQLLESGQPIQFVLNMKDELHANGYTIDLEKFQQFFGPGLFISANKSLKVDKVREHLKKVPSQSFRLDYEALEKIIAEMIPIIDRCSDLQFESRFYALQLLAKNKLVFNLFSEKESKKLEQLVYEAECYILENELATSLNGYLFKVRRQYIQDALEKIFIENPTQLKNQQMGIKMDKIILHPVMGSLIFLGIFYLIYYITFALGDIVTAFLEEYPLAMIQEGLVWLLEKMSMPPFIVGVLIDGAYAGFATIVMFLPQIILVFFFIAILEGTGYMSRSIIVFDKLLSRFGLNGRTLVPMMIGLGCSVPAIMASRTIADKRERLTTQMIVPFISCAARLEIYVFFIALFFDKHQAFILLGLNILGVLLALIAAKILSSSIFKKKDSFFLVELPPYRKVNVTYIYKLTRNKIMQFLNNAGKFIVIGSIIIWLLLAIGPTGIVDSVDDSFFALIGKLFAWMFIPLGFGNWQAASTLITGFLAKELVVAQLGVLLSSAPSIEQGVQAIFTWKSALSFMVFNLLYIPCLSTIATMHAEMKTWKWPLFSIVFSFIMAYIVSFIVYNIVLFF